MHTPHKRSRTPFPVAAHTSAPADDDEMRGTLLSRKEAMTILAGAGAFMLIGRTAFGQTDTCVVRPALTEGPYYVEDALERSDVRYDPADGTTKEGVPLNITFEVTEVVDGACVPLADAIVEIWHCDADGVYSGVSDPGFDTSDKMFLRGYQVTDANGVVNFTTIYPGWYSGRAVHIHFKVRSNNSAASEFEFTSQLFFDETITDEVHDTEIYNSKGYRDTLNSEDNIYANGGDQLVLDLAGDTAGGYLSVFNIALELDSLNNGDTIADVAGVDCATPAAATSTALASAGIMGVLTGLLSFLRPPGGAS